MPSQLVHYFNPDFDHFHLTPSEKTDGSVDHYNLGYAQNVITGQVLAERIPEGALLPPSAKSEYLRQGDTLPAGPNTKINPDNPAQLIATENGYVFYHNGVITVKKLLNVRRDVDFHTGNIVFVGDVCVHGSVRTGFDVHGKNILVKGTVEGARLRAQGNISSMNGVKGAKTAFLEAGGDIRLPFIENAELLAKGDILIDGTVMHTDIWAGRNIAVKGRLQGGNIYANQIVYVAEQLGGGISTVTSIVMGYNPHTLRQLHKVEHAIQKLRTSMEQMKNSMIKNDFLRDELEPKLVAAQKQHDALFKRRSRLGESMKQETFGTAPRVIVPGQVRPGVEISIGGAYLMIQDFMENVCMYRKDDEIVIESPAMDKKQ